MKTKRPKLPMPRRRLALLWLLVPCLLLLAAYITDVYRFTPDQAQRLEEKCRACLELHVDDAPTASLILEKTLGTHDYEVINAAVIRLYSHLDQPGAVARAMVEGGVTLSALESRGANLEDYFLNLIGGARHA